MVQLADCTTDCTADYRLNLYITVCHTNKRPIKNTIGVVMDRLVGMGLKYPAESAISQVRTHVHLICSNPRAPFGPLTYI